MYLRRKIYEKLVDWKNKRNGSVALLIEGARRIGKSFVVESFARQEYESFLLIDFSTARKEVRQLFELHLNDLDTLFLALSTYYPDAKLMPRPRRDKPARSLVIFDEVQCCPRARAAIKHLVADARYDYIETGSLVSIKKNVKDILIPSEEHALQMYPLDFEEFLWATGQEALVQLIRKNFEIMRPMGPVHRKALELFRLYLIVGGMPQAVVTFAQKKAFDEVEFIKQEILSLYRSDIAHYADRQEANVTAIFDNIPGQLQKHDRKFRLANIKPGARMRDFSTAFFWLSDSRVVNCCFNATSPALGLRLNEDRTSVKCYLGDTGLLVSMAFSDRGAVSAEIYQKLMSGKLEANLGMIYENCVAQMLRASGHRLYFFSNYSKSSAADTMEIDFLLARSKISSRHNIDLIEVKSGRNFSLSSLMKCRAKYAQQVGTAYVLSEKDLEVTDGVTYLPVYMTGLL